MREPGFTLFELLLAVGIVGALALALVMGVTASSEQRRLEVAAEEVAGALRFARDEARRAGAPHGVRITASESRIRVYELDTSGTPPVEQYTVYHPVHRQLYDVRLSEAPFTSGVEVQSSDFRFGGDPTPKESVAFRATGSAISPEDLDLQDSGNVVLTHGGRVRTLSVAPRTGRVTIQ